MNNICRIATAVAALAFAVGAAAAETDQFYNRAEPLADSTDVLNRKFNQKLARVIDRNRNEREQALIVHEVFAALGGYGMTDWFEQWVLHSPAVARRNVALQESVYGGMPFWSIRMIAVSGLGTTLRVNGQLIGSDKLSHFLSQGRKYYRRYLASKSEFEAAQRGILTERAIFGAMSTGTFSNADLVANYEGHRFYRSLFEDEIVPGKPAILRWTGNEWLMQREFDWSDHVNAFWDEALNVNAYDPLLYDRMLARLEGLCPQYRQDPDSYSVADAAVLEQRYAHLGLRDTSDLRLDSLCENDAEKDAGGMFAAL